MVSIPSTTTNSKEPLQLSPITLREEYCKKWNLLSSDFVVLTRGSQQINRSLYRLGGMGSKPDGKNYFMLLKYFEAYWDKEWQIKIGSKSPQEHLKGLWCILDKDGNEVVTFFNTVDSPSLIKDSCLYVFNRNIYNLITNERYKYSEYMVSEKSVFISKKYYRSGSVLQVDKVTGQTIIHP